MRSAPAPIALTALLALASTADAQRRLELGSDVGLVFGLGDQSSVNVDFPGSRFRVGVFQPGSRISIEPALGFSYDKVEGADGLSVYDLEPRSRDCPTSRVSGSRPPAASRGSNARHSEGSNRPVATMPTGRLRSAVPVPRPPGSVPVPQPAHQDAPRT